MVRWWDPKWRYVWETVAATIVWAIVLIVVALFFFWIRL
jgi:hypothetical protein